MDLSNWNKRFTSSFFAQIDPRNVKYNSNLPEILRLPAKIISYTT